MDLLAEHLPQGGRDPTARRVSAPTPNRDAGDLASVTGEHYGRLFREFGDVVSEPVARCATPRTQLRQRGLLKGQRVLDAGCGGGRYRWRGACSALRT
jgi:2-polyprenyl-3-methyl-5-hydroxy-6-metoxy-1,4-benzoquinol methylase